MFCRFWCIYKILLFLGLSDWNLHLYNLLHNPELHCVIVDFSAELFPAFQGNSWNFLLICEINKIMTQLCIRFHVLAFTHVWYSRFSLASLHRFLIIKPFSRADFPNKNHPKPSSEHCRESQSSVRSCFYTAGALIDAWLHHLEKLPTSLSAHHVGPQHPGDHYPANTGRTQLFGFSIKPILWNEAW